MLYNLNTCKCFSFYVEQFCEVYYDNLLRHLQTLNLMAHEVHAILFRHYYRRVRINFGHISMHQLHVAKAYENLTKLT